MCAFLRYTPPPAPNQESKQTKLYCRRVKSLRANPINGYIIIGTCPSSWVNNETVHACMSTNHTADPLVALPVLDVKTNVTYANTYCAMCHNIKSRNLQYWIVRVASRLGNIVSPKNVTSRDTVWEAVPAEVIPDRCIVTPSENSEPESEMKHLCRGYANAIEVFEDDINSNNKFFKNPHCALLSNPNVLVNRTVRCKVDNLGFPPKLISMLFLFSADDKDSTPLEIRGFRRVIFKCKESEVYDPFQEKCVPTHSDHLKRNTRNRKNTNNRRNPTNHRNTTNNRNTTNHTNTTNGHCRGPRFPPQEFLISKNKSVFILPHKKLYSNNSYILMNETLILCSNFSRYLTIHVYPIKVTPTSKNIKPRDHSLTFRIITYVGFSLSIIALLFLLMTYFLFAELCTYPGKMVMQLSCAMIAMQSVYFASDPDIVSSVVCSVMGALLHYFILAVFLWMSVIAHNTQKTFSKPSK